MKSRLLAVALATGALLALTTHVAEAQTITSDPIQTVPGFPGCGGNSSQQDVTASFTCANQRTFHFGTVTRTVVAVSTFNPDGTASTTYTLTGGNAPLAIPLTIRAWSGVSAGGVLFSTTSGTIPQGTKGPVTLSYTFDCGQVDIKAVLTSTSDTNGRISGPFVCKPMVAPTTTAAPTTAPGSTTPATTSPSQSTVPTTVSGGPGVSASARVVTALPETGSETRGIFYYGVLASVVGAALVIIAFSRRKAHS